MSDNDVSSAFSHLPPELQGDLKLLFEEHRYSPGQEVFLQGDPSESIYIVAEGQVKLTRAAREGFESVLCVRRPGEYFCPVSVIDRGPQLGTAEAMGQVLLLEADREQFNSLCEDNPVLLAMVQGTCIGEVRKLMQRVETFAFRNVRERLAVTILEESHRQRLNGKPVDEIRITQQELAGLVAASRESISRTMTLLEQDGMVQTGRGRIRILDREQLRELSGGTK
ncbi:MAG: Crp/Fnr family transcriptional regulator [Anaerolineae bacterium]|nr:MAG: Crp/Fnr family transcriptional regulator [Anaerolineae bacterium]